MLTLDCVNAILVETLEERSSTSEHILGAIP